MTRKRDENEINNRTENRTFSNVLEQRLSRRSWLKFTGLTLGAATVTLLPKPLLGVEQKGGAGGSLGKQLTFKPIAPSTLDSVIVPEGYRATPLYAWGDPVGIPKMSPRFKQDASNSAEEQAYQAGMHHDGIAYFPLQEGKGASEHGLLAMNHEYVDNGLLFPDGEENWSIEKVRKSQNAMGVSVIEVIRRDNRWEVVRPSRYARRITPHTQMDISGPARGHQLMRSAADRDGTTILGTMQNCANGETPWGTYLTCEENWSDIFVKEEGELTPLEARYGISRSDTAYRWYEYDERFNVNKTPNEPNRFGWVVEINPFDPDSTPVKHTALGRFKHEGAKVVIAPNGQIVVYMGDDQKFEYIYKYVSNGQFDPARGLANSELLSDGTLYVARFNEDGSGEWLPLIYGIGPLEERNGFSNQGDVVINARSAADHVGATKMDRPEWITADPLNPGSIYCTLTNNNQRGAEGYPDIDGANPRANNLFGHIIHWLEEGGDVTATQFKWDILALAGTDTALNMNHQPDHEGDRFGSPDGLAFDHNGLLWVQTDVSTSALNRGVYQGLGNNQMLAVDPEVGEFKRFLTAPVGSEVTGIAFTADNRTLFINIQHPGEPLKGSSDPKQPTAISSWPDGVNAGRPRSATVVIEREDGGIIGH